MFNFKHSLMCLPEVDLNVLSCTTQTAQPHLLGTCNLKMQDLLFYYENKKKNSHVEMI